LEKLALEAALKEYGNAITVVEQTTPPIPVIPKGVLV